MTRSAEPLEDAKIMSGESLDDIVERLNGCNALIWAICQTAGLGTTPEDALRGVADLLSCITRDLEADIAAAEDYQEGWTQHGGGE